MRMSPTRLDANYGLEFVEPTIESEGEYPVVVTVRDVDQRADDRARQVCRGLRWCAQPGSDSIGAVPRGDFANHAWGVVDMLAVTDFPTFGSSRPSSPQTRATSC
jgi:phenol 2-monooxygenase